MDFGWFALLLIAAFVIGAVLNGVHGTASANNLQKDLISLGVVTGKTYDEIAKVLGDPKYSHANGNVTAHLWSSVTLPGAPSYSCTVLFEDGVCVGIAGEDYHRPG